MWLSEVLWKDPLKAVTVKKALTEPQCSKSLQSLESFQSKDKKNKKKTKLWNLNE